MYNFSRRDGVLQLTGAALPPAKLGGGSPGRSIHRHQLLPGEHAQPIGSQAILSSTSHSGTGRHVIGHRYVKVWDEGKAVIKLPCMVMSSGRSAIACHFRRLD